LATSEIPGHDSNGNTDCARWTVYNFCFPALEIRVINFIRVHLACTLWDPSEMATDVKDKETEIKKLK